VQSPRATRLNADKRRRGDGSGALDEDERADLARLRMENEFLKKAAAFFARTHP